MGASSSRWGGTNFAAAHPALVSPRRPGVSTLSSSETDTSSRKNSVQSCKSTTHNNSNNSSNTNKNKSVPVHATVSNSSNSGGGPLSSSASVSCWRDYLTEEEEASLRVEVMQLGLDWALLEEHKTELIARWTAYLLQSPLYGHSTLPDTDVNPAGDAAIAEELRAARAHFAVTPALRLAALLLEADGLTRMADALLYLLSGGEVPLTLQRHISGAAASMTGRSMSGSFNHELTHYQQGTGYTGGGGGSLGAAHSYGGAMNNSWSSPRRFATTTAGGGGAAPTQRSASRLATSAPNRGPGGDITFLHTAASLDDVRATVVPRSPQRGSASGTEASLLRPQWEAAPLLLPVSGETAPHHRTPTSLGEQDYNNGLLTSMNARSSMQWSMSCSMGRGEGMASTSVAPLTPCRGRSPRAPPVDDAQGSSCTLWSVPTPPPGEGAGFLPPLQGAPNTLVAGGGGLVNPCDGASGGNLSARQRASTALYTKRTNAALTPFSLGLLTASTEAAPPPPSPLSVVGAGTGVGMRRSTSVGSLSRRRSSSDTLSMSGGVAPSSIVAIMDVGDDGLGGGVHGHNGFDTRLIESGLFLLSPAAVMRSLCVLFAHLSIEEGDVVVCIATLAAVAQELQRELAEDRREGEEDTPDESSSASSRGPPPVVPIAQLHGLLSRLLQRCLLPCLRSVQEMLALGANDYEAATAAVLAATTADGLHSSALQSPGPMTPLPPPPRTGASSGTPTRPPGAFSNEHAKPRPVQRMKDFFHMECPLDTASGLPGLQQFLTTVARSTMTGTFRTRSSLSYHHSGSPRPLAPPHGLAPGSGGSITPQGPTAGPGRPTAKMASMLDSPAGPSTSPSISQDSIAGSPRGGQLSCSTIVSSLMSSRGLGGGSPAHRTTSLSARSESRVANHYLMRCESAYVLHFAERMPAEKPASDALNFWLGRGALAPDRQPDVFLRYRSPSANTADSTLLPLRTRLLCLRHHFLYVYDAMTSSLTYAGGDDPIVEKHDAAGSPEEERSLFRSLHAAPGTPMVLMNMFGGHGAGSSFQIVSGVGDIEVASIMPSRVYLPVTTGRTKSTTPGSSSPSSPIRSGGPSAEADKVAATTGGIVLSVAGCVSDTDVFRVRNSSGVVHLLTLPLQCKGPEAPAGEDHRGPNAGRKGMEGASYLRAMFDRNKVARPQVLSLSSGGTDQTASSSTGPSGAAAGAGGNAAASPSTELVSRCGRDDDADGLAIIPGNDPHRAVVYPLRVLYCGVLHHFFFPNPSTRDHWCQKLAAISSMIRCKARMEKVAAAPQDVGAFLRHRISFPTGPAAFRVLDMLGAGTFGRVLLVQHRLSRRLYAMKVIRKCGFHGIRNVVEARREKSMLEGLDCPYVMKIHHVFQTDSRIYLLFDYLPGAELLLHTQSAPSRHFDEATARFYIAELAVAVEYLRRRGIVHRDIKGDNLVLDEEGHVVLTDFGFAKRIVELEGGESSEEEDEEGDSMSDGSGMESDSNGAENSGEEIQSRRAPGPASRTDSRVGAGAPALPVRPHRQPHVVPQHTSCGTLAYIAPEVLYNSRRNLGYGLAVDWWSLGVVLFTFLTGYFPFLKGSGHETSQAIVHSALQFPPRPALSDAAKDLLHRLLHKDPRQRVCSLAQLRRHQFFDGFDWDACIQRRLPPPLVLHKDSYQPPRSTQEARQQLLERTEKALHLQQARLSAAAAARPQTAQDETLEEERHDAQEPPLFSARAATDPLAIKYKPLLEQEVKVLGLLEQVYGAHTVPTPTSAAYDVFGPLYLRQEKCGSDREETDDEELDMASYIPTMAAMRATPKQEADHHNARGQRPRRRGRRAGGGAVLGAETDGKRFVYLCQKAQTTRTAPALTRSGLLPFLVDYSETAYTTTANADTQEN